MKTRDTRRTVHAGLRAACAALAVASALPAALVAQDAPLDGARTAAELDRAVRIANTVAYTVRLPDVDPVPPGYELVDDMILPIAGYAGAEEFDQWAGGVVPYVIDTNFNATEVAEILAAMQEWESVANVDFVPATITDVPYAIVRKDMSNQTCSSGVGKPAVYLTVTLAAACFGDYTVHHELGHALGFFHEQSRMDRDDYVTILEDNVQPDKLSNFKKQGVANPYGPYDFDSVMHYDATDFGIGGATTIVTHDPAMQSVIGQRTHLSEWDVNVMSFLYSEDDWVFFGDGVDPLIDSGTFQRPFETGGAAWEAALDSAGLTLIVLEPYEGSLAGPLTEGMVIEAPVGGLVLR